MATGAAFRIEQFILGIERGMRATAKSRDMAVEGLSPKYKFELERLLLISPSITELTAIDTDGFDRVQVARFKRTFPKSRTRQCITGPLLRFKQPCRVRRISAQSILSEVPSHT